MRKYRRCQVAGNNSTKVAGCEYADGKGMQKGSRQETGDRRQNSQEVSSCLCHGLRVGIGIEIGVGVVVGLGIGIGLTNKMAL